MQRELGYSLLSGLWREKEEKKGEEERERWSRIERQQPSLQKRDEKRAHRLEEGEDPIALATEVE